MSEVFFYLLAALMIAFAICVVTVKNILYAALALISTFFITAILYLMLQAEFVAIAQVLVYIGGVVIFIVFAILLTSRLGEAHLASSPGKKLFGVIIAGGLLLFFAGAIRHGSAALQRAGSHSDTAALDAVGIRLLQVDGSGFIVPFEIISILLLSAMIGAIVIARRDPKPERGEK